MFVDSDDYLDKEMVNRLMDALVLNDADISMCSRNAVSSGFITPTHLFDSNIVFNNKDVMYLILKDVIGSQPWAKLFKKELLIMWRFPEGRLYEDIGTMYLAFYNCKRFSYIRQPLYYL